MIKDALHKVIESFVLPKYPWIYSYTISLYYDSPLEKYAVKYYVEPEENGSFTVTNEMSEVETITYDLFKMLGPDYGQFLNEVIFLIKQ